MRGMPSFADPDNLVSTAEPMIEGANTLEFLHAIYRSASYRVDGVADPRPPLSARMRGAIEALPFESPKLSATAVVQGRDFASLLEARLRRIEEAKSKSIEAYD